MAVQHTTTPQQIPTLASAVVAVILRVAGPVITDVRAHAVGTPERQINARIGDALIYLTDRRLAARIRQQWDAAQYIATQRLPERVSQTWLAHSSDVYPVGVTLQLTGQVKVGARYLPARPDTHTHRTCGCASTASCGRCATCRRGARSVTPGSRRSVTLRAECQGVRRSAVDSIELSTAARHRASRHGSPGPRCIP